MAQIKEIQDLKNNVSKNNTEEMEFLNYVIPSANNDFSGLKITKYKKIFYFVVDETTVEPSVAYLRFQNIGIKICCPSSVENFKEVSNILLEIIKNQFNNLKTEDDYCNFKKFCRTEESLYEKIKTYGVRYICKKE